MVPPRRFRRNGFGDQIFNNEIIASILLYFNNLDALRMKKFVWSPNNSSRGINLVQKQVHDDARCRDIEPYRENKPGQSSMRVVPALQPASERNYHKRCDTRGQYRMRCKDREIDRPDNALTGEPGRPEPKIVRP